MRQPLLSLRNEMCFGQHVTTSSSFQNRWSFEEIVLKKRSAIYWFQVETLLRMRITGLVLLAVPTCQPCICGTNLVRQ